MLEVKIRADISRLVLEIDSKGVVTASGNLEIFSKKSKEAEKSASNLDDVLRGISPSALTAVAGVTALVGALKGLISSGKSMVQTFSHFESLQSGLETFFQSASKGRAKFEELRKLSNETTFGVDELTDSFTQLANVGVPVDKINGQLMMLGNIAGGSKEKFADLVQIYAKINSTGKAGSMQLQQIATRGVPIYDMLKQIGVTGQATAEDITTAFKKMTAEGGQFYNAMENINNTIEGKEGFISDYFREMTVNFVEVTGIANAYKKLLDILKDAIGKVSDWLLSINNNPLMKALLSGVITMAVVSLVTVISVSLVSALNTVISKLVTINMLSGWKGWVTLAVAGVAGLGVGIYNLTKKTDEGAESTKRYGTEIHTFTYELGKASEESIKYVGAINKITESYNAISTNGKSNALLDNFYERMFDPERIDSQIEAIEKQLEESYSSNDVWREFYDIQQDVNYEYDEQYNRLVKELNLLKENKAMFETILAVQVGQTVATENRILREKELNDEIQKQNEKYLAQLKTVEKMYKTTNKGKLEELTAQITEYENLINNGVKEITQNKNPMYGKISGVPEYINSYNFRKLNDEESKFFTESLKVIKEQKKKIEDELNLERILNEDGGWRKIMQEALGTTNEEVLKGSLDNGGKAIEEYMKTLTGKYDIINKTNEMLGLNKEEGGKNSISSQISELFSIYNKLLATGKFGVQADGSLDNTTQKIQEEMEKLKEKFKEAGGTVEEFDEIVKNSNSKSKKDSLGDFTKNSLTSAFGGSDAGNIMNSMINNGTDFKTALLETAISDFTSLLSEITPVLSPIKYLLQGLEPVIKLIGIVLSPVVLLFKKLGDGLKGLFKDSGIDEAWDAIKNELTDTEDNLSAVNAEYKKLLSSMKEQEEYYIREKKRLLSEDYVSQIYAKPVNDMILTDKGVFSTSPQDTIMAMKHPENLGGGTLQPIINNYAGDDVNVRQERGADGITRLIVDISKQVALDYAQGFNGWNDAVKYRNAMTNGRSVM